jgi:ribosome biogenesis GTPase
LLTEDELVETNKVIAYYEKIGYQIFRNNELDKIKEIFKDKVSVFTGQSGAGKSTLLNNLDKSLNIKTNEISMALNRGKHTTRHVELLRILGGLIADTPGFSAIDFNDMTNEDIRDNFIEFNEYRYDCKYSTCMHIDKNVCEVMKKVEDGTILKSRYTNYLKFIRRDNEINKFTKSR